jgi:hypothetical protein
MIEATLDMTPFHVHASRSGNSQPLRVESALAYSNNPTSPTTCWSVSGTAQYVVQPTTTCCCASTTSTTTATSGLQQSVLPLSPDSVSPPRSKMYEEGQKTVPTTKVLFEYLPQRQVWEKNPRPGDLRVHPGELAVCEEPAQRDS